jgi:N-acetylglucosamine-6-sulfatase
MRVWSRKFVRSTALCMSLMLFAPGAAGPWAQVATPPSANTPSNVLFVLTDDMTLDDLQFMPQVAGLIADQGMTFDSEFDNVTLCCPARTSILRGQYSHNTGVLTNGGSNGGFETAHADNLEQSTIATAMRDAGYTTALFGKYLNGYPNTVSTSYIPPGWDTWSSSIKGNAYGEYRYTLNQNGKPVLYGDQPQDYGTNVYVSQARDFINQAAQKGAPFFAYLAVYAPHQPATPANQDLKTFPGLQAPRTAAFNEPNVSDKPQFIRDLPLLSQQQQRNIDNLYRRRAQSLQAVDRGVADLVNQLRQNGQLDNTYIIFTSDNGFHMGQHRMPSGKMTAYEPDIHLPLLVRGPGVQAGTHVRAITGNIDLAPTIAQLGGATLTDNPDGRSLVPFLTGNPGPDPDNPASPTRMIATPPDWRQVYLLEHWTDTSTVVQDRSGAGQLEPDDPDQGGVTPGDDTTQQAGQSPAGLVKMPQFMGLRLPGFTYVEYTTGEKELYDLNADPEELRNLASSASPAFLAELSQRLDDLSDCAGDSCRGIELPAVNVTP